MDDIEVMIEASQADASDGPGLFVAVTTSEGFYEGEWLNNPTPSVAVTITDALEWAVEQVSNLYAVSLEDFTFDAIANRFHAEAERRPQGVSMAELVDALDSVGVSIADAAHVGFCYLLGSNPFIQVTGEGGVSTVYRIKE